MAKKMCSRLRGNAKYFGVWCRSPFVMRDNKEGFRLTVEIYGRPSLP